TDNDLQGSDGSGSLGGPDVRRRIPIKLISKQPLRSKPPPRIQRPSCRPPKIEPGEDDNFGFKQDDRFDCGAKAVEVYPGQRRFPQPLFWDYKVHKSLVNHLFLLGMMIMIVCYVVPNDIDLFNFQLNLIGEKDEVPLHFCDKCGLPIQIYGRMIPCKHVFCYDCALLHEKKGEKMCPGLTLYNCTDPVQRIEQCQRGSLYMCSVVPGCKRTYLSQRDLQAHVNHRHIRAAKSSAGRQEPVHMTPVPEHFGPPPPPPPPIGHQMPHPPQASGTPHMVYSQAPPPPMSSAPPPITPPPGHIMAQIPPYMNHPHQGPPPQHSGPPVNAPPPHHYNPNAMQQFPEDQGTLSPPFSQPGGLSPGMWPAPRGPPPRMQGPPQAQMPGPHHADQVRYRQYYQ
ncbi:unnamed protein product, partial [Tetraodon nigroviridis]